MGYKEKISTEIVYLSVRVYEEAKTRVNICVERWLIIVGVHLDSTLSPYPLFLLMDEITFAEDVILEGESIVNK